MRFRKLSALTGSAVLALSACGTPLTDAQSDSPAEEPQTPPPDVSKPATAQPAPTSEYVADLALYLPDVAVDYSPADIETISTAAATLIQSCLADRGVDAPLLGIVSAAEIEADRSARLHRLLFDEREAVLAHGYDTILAIEGEPTTQPALLTDNDGINEYSYECRGQAYAEISGDPTVFLANIPPSASEVGGFFEGIFDAETLGAPLSEWAQCMETAGYEAPALGVRFDIERRGSDEEKALALADHDCRTTTGLRTAVANAMAERVERYLAENQAEVEDFRARQAAEVSRAREVLAQAGGS